MIRFHSNLDLLGTNSITNVNHVNCKELTVTGPVTCVDIVTTADVEVGGSLNVIGNAACVSLTCNDIVTLSQVDVGGDLKVAFDISSKILKLRAWDGVEDPDGDSVYKQVFDTLIPTVL